MVEEVFGGPSEDGAYDIDFTGVEESRIILAGVYPVRVDESEIKNSGASGQPTLYLTLEIMGPEKYVGRKLRASISLQAQVRFRIQQALAALGYAKEELQGRIRLVPSALVERTCGAVVSIGTNNGEQVNNVSRFVPIEKVPAENIGSPEAPFAAGGSEESVF